MIKNVLNHFPWGTRSPNSTMQIACTSTHASWKSGHLYPRPKTGFKFQYCGPIFGPRIWLLFWGRKAQTGATQYGRYQLRAASPIKYTELLNMGRDDGFVCQRKLKVAHIRDTPRVHAGFGLHSLLICSSGFGLPRIALTIGTSPIATAESLPMFYV